MQLVTHVSCGNCGQPHRIHRRNLSRRARYRFRCKLCNAEVTFGLRSVRWSVLAQQDEESEEALRRSLSRTASWTRDTEIDLPAAPPPTPAHPDALAARDTLLDQAAPASIAGETLQGYPTADPPLAPRDTLVDVCTPAPEPIAEPQPPRPPRAPCERDTLLDARPPIHLSPLMRRGVTCERESSRVQWLRSRCAAATG